MEAITETKNPQDQKSGVEWSVKGWQFDPAHPDKPVMGQLPLPSTEVSVKMPGPGKVHSGMPIDASLAVHFIQNFLNNYEIVFQPHSDDLQSIVNNKDFDSLLTLHKKVKQAHDAVVNITYGMTLDKDLVLKMISQPKCEGVRFYLCARKLEDGYMHLSLVTVGVDENGYDLHYNKPETLQPQIVAGVQNVATQSLTGEYFTPPPYNSTISGTIVNHILENKVSDDFYERFILLNLAKHPAGTTSPNNTTPTSGTTPAGTAAPTGTPILKNDPAKQVTGTSA